MSEQLVNYIVQQINAGYKVDDIENFLRTNNYSVNDIKSSVDVAIDLAARSYINYIDQQIKAGYKLPQIRESLVSQGYDYRIVDSAMSNYHANIFSSFKEKLENRVQLENEKKQLSSQISSSVSQGLNYGLTLENIQSNLVNQGYDPNLVSKEINKFRQSQIHIPKNTFAMLILIVFLVGGGIGIFSLVSNQLNPAMQERLLDVRAENSHPNIPISPGSYLHFHVERVPMGYQREFDIDFEYNVYDRSGNLIAHSSATKSIVSNLGDRILIPSQTRPGTYRLEVIAEYMGEVHARSSFEFTVATESVPTPAPDPVPTPVQPKDDTDESVDSDVPAIPSEPTPIIPPPTIPREPVDVTPDDETTFSSIGNMRNLRLSDRNRLSKLVNDGDYEYALFLCERIKDSSLQITCKTFVATEAQDISICKSMDDDKGDSCFVEFAKTSTDPSICENIVKRNFISLCKLHIIRNNNVGLSEDDDQTSYHDLIKKLYT